MTSGINWAAGSRASLKVPPRGLVPFWVVVTLQSSEPSPRVVPSPSLEQSMSGKRPTFFPHAFENLPAPVLGHVSAQSAGSPTQLPSMYVSEAEWSVGSCQVLESKTIVHV